MASRTAFTMSMTMTTACTMSVAMRTAFTMSTAVWVVWMVAFATLAVTYGAWTKTRPFLAAFDMKLSSLRVCTKAMLVMAALEVLMPESMTLVMASGLTAPPSFPTIRAK